MESFDVEGHFWPVDEPEKKISGRLRFDDKKGVELDLIGTFDSFHAASKEKDHPRILGLVAGGKSVTLENCLNGGTSGELLSGFHRQSHSAQFLFQGAHFEPDESLEFTSISVATDHLAHWVQRAEIETAVDRNISNRRSVSMNLTVPENETLDLERGRLSLGFFWKTEGDSLTSKRLTHACKFKLEFDDLVPLPKLLRFGQAIQDLVTIGIDVPVLFSSVELKRPDVVHKFEDGTHIDLPITFFAAPAAKVERSPKPPPRHRIIFSYEQLGGINGVAAWLAVAEKFRPVLGSLLSFRYSPMYMENKFQNCLQAAETFHRIGLTNEIDPKAVFKSKKRKALRNVPSRVQRDWINRELQYANEKRLRRRLDEMASLAGTIFSELVGDPIAWTKRVTNQRNALVHRDPRRTVSDSNGGTLYFLAESAYFLVVLCLLRECGVPDEVLQRIGKNDRFTWIAKHVKEELLKSDGSS